MAALALGLAGAALGGLAGQATLGWMIGTSVGSMLFAPSFHEEGPRLQDLKLQASTWGKAIPVVYGAMRIAGNLIWSAGIVEHKQVGTMGGKGGPSVETTTYSYTASFAISLCEGPIASIRKIWANGTLIYNNDPGADAQTLINNRANQIRIYLGDEAQLPDPTIEAALGAGNAPAYRGQVYVVLRDWPLANYGNRLPNLEFEVLQVGQRVGFRALVERNNPEFSTVLSLDKLILSVNNGVIRVSRSQALAPVEVFGDDGRFLGFETRRDDEARLLLNHASTLLGTPGHTFIEIQIDPIRPPPWGDPRFPRLVLLKNGVPWWSTAIPDNEYLAGAVLSADYQVLMITTFIVNDGQRAGMHWYQFALDGRLRRAGPVQPDPSLQPWFNWRRDVWGTLVPRYRPAALESDYTHLWCHATVETSCCLYAIDASGLLAPKNLFHGSGWSATPAIWADDGVCVIVDTSSVKIFTRLDSIAPAQALLADIVRDQCRRAGLNDAQIDVSALKDTVHGYAIGRQGSARANLAPLLRACFVDAAESEGRIKFIPRGGAPVASMAFDELAAHRSADEVPDPLQSTRQQETELPVAVTISYPNVDADYLVGSETCRRQLTPSKLAVTEELGIAMTPDRAATIAAVLLYDAHVARSSCRFRTSRAYVMLEPADVVLLHTPETTQRLRITQKTDEDSLITFEAVADDAQVYTTEATGASQIVPQTSVAQPGPTRLQCLDIPILRDEDNDAGCYIALSGYKDAWRGATLFRAIDNLAFEPVASVTNGAVFGMVVAPLVAGSGTNFPDEASTVEVTLIQGSLASITFDALLNGGNAALIGNEIVQFRTATLIGANRYRLGGMLRGRQGTGRFANTHGFNENFVLLTEAGLLRVNEGMAGLNAPRYYKAASFGSSVARAGSYAFTNTGNGLRPWQPAHITAARQPNGDWLLRWVRRARLDGLWRDAVDAGLGEASEAYELEILYGSAVRRVVTSSTPSINYSAAQQTADFGTTQRGISVRLYQLSASIGRSEAVVVTFT